LRSNSI